MSKYGVFSGPYFPIFGLNTIKHELEKTPYLDPTLLKTFLYNLSIKIYAFHREFRFYKENGVRSNTEFP